MMAEMTNALIRDCVYARGYLWFFFSGKITLRDICIQFLLNHLNRWYPQGGMTNTLLPASMFRDNGIHLCLLLLATLSLYSVLWCQYMLVAPLALGDILSFFTEHFCMLLFLPITFLLILGVDITLGKIIILQLLTHWVFLSASFQSCSIPRP